MENKPKVFFSRIWRIGGKYLGLHEKCDEVRVVWGRQNRLRICSKYL